MGQSQPVGRHRYHNFTHEETFRDDDDLSSTIFSKNMVPIYSGGLGYGYDESVTYRVIVLVDLFGSPILRVSHLPIFIHAK